MACFCFWPATGTTAWHVGAKEVTTTNEANAAASRRQGVTSRHTRWPWEIPSLRYHVEEGRDQTSSRCSSKAFPHQLTRVIFTTSRSIQGSLNFLSDIGIAKRERILVMFLAKTSVALGLVHCSCLCIFLVSVEILLSSRLRSGAKKPLVLPFRTVLQAVGASKNSHSCVQQTKSKHMYVLQDSVAASPLDLCGSMIKRMYNLWRLVK